MSKKEKCQFSATEARYEVAPEGSTKRAYDRQFTSYLSCSLC